MLPTFDGVGVFIMRHKKQAFTVGVVCVLSLPLGASAGVFNESGVGETYSFTDCVKPDALSPSSFAEKKGRALARARRNAIDRYNTYLEDVNVYLSCLAQEAERDIGRSHQAISSAFDAEQTRVLTDLELERKAITATHNGRQMESSRRA